MAWPWSAWPGPGGPILSEAVAYECGLRVVASARAHIPTQRLRFAATLALTLLMPVPVLAGGLPAYLLLPIPVVWLLLPWMVRRDWQATEAVFASDRLLLRHGERGDQPYGVLLQDLVRIEATQDLFQRRTGSCTLHFVALVPDPDDPLQASTKPVAAVRDVEAALAQRILAHYASSPPDRAGPA